MKYYRIEGISMGRNISVKKKFHSKTDALTYVFSLLPDGTEIRESYPSGNDGMIMNYKCNNSTVFAIQKL